MLVIKRRELIRYLVHIEFLLVAGSESIYKCLPFVVVRHGGKKLLPRFVDGSVRAVLYDVFRADQLHQRTNVPFVHRVNGGICLDRGRVALRRVRAWPRGLHRILRSTLNHQKKCADVNKDQCQDRFHDFLRGSAGGSRHANDFRKRLGAARLDRGTVVPRRLLAPRSGPSTGSEFLLRCPPCKKWKRKRAQSWQRLIPLGLLNVKRDFTRTSPLGKSP